MIPSAENQPKISVIIPVYNMSAYLKDALESLRSQTLKEWEAVCIDDGSTDASPEILEAYARMDARFRVFRQENRGVSAARNRAIELAAGEYLFFLDPDDWLADEGVFSDLYAAAVLHGVHICGGSFREYAGDRVVTEWTGKNAPYTFARDGMVSYADYQFDYGWVRFIYDRDFIVGSGFRLPEYTFFEDPVFFVRAMDKARVFYALRRPVYCYRRGHKPRELSYGRTLDLVRGLRDNIVFANDRGYSQLAALETTRLLSEYSGHILRYAHEEDARELRALLEEVDSVLYPDQGGRIAYLMCRNQLDKEQARQMKLSDELNRIKGSRTWKLGRILTAIPRRIRRVFSTLLSRPRRED